MSPPTVNEEEMMVYIGRMAEFVANKMECSCGGVYTCFKCTYGTKECCDFCQQNKVDCVETYGGRKICGQCAQ